MQYQKPVPLSSGGTLVPATGEVAHTQVCLQKTNLLTHSHVVQPLMTVVHNNTPVY